MDDLEILNLLLDRIRNPVVGRIISYCIFFALFHYSFIRSRSREAVYSCLELCKRVIPEDKIKDSLPDMKIFCTALLINLGHSRKGAEKVYEKKLKEWELSRTV